MYVLEQILHKLSKKIQVMSANLQPSEQPTNITPAEFKKAIRLINLGSDSLIVVDITKPIPANSAFSRASARFKSIHLGGCFDEPTSCAD
jgi:hypothetical protein